MGKPLLTDEIIESAKMGEFPDNAEVDSQDTQVFSDLGDDFEDGDYVYKSRRIENAKRKEFQSKLNKILLVIVILLLALLFAIFKL